MPFSDETNQEYQYRFASLGRLFGTEASQRLQNSHVLLVGLGGVGSWCAEALARSGVGHISLVDHDEICVSNINRQVHALTNLVGRLKVEVLGERLKAINPKLNLMLRPERFDHETAPAILTLKPHYVVDAIDSLTFKCLLLASCRDLNIPVITSGSSGGRRDPTQLRINDLAFAKGDRLLQRVRKKLRQNYAFPRPIRQAFGIAAAYSLESPYYPNESGCVSQDPDLKPQKPLDCASGLGTASFLTGALGFAMAYRVVNELALNSALTQIDGLR